VEAEASIILEQIAQFVLTFLPNLSQFALPKIRLVRSLARPHLHARCSVFKEQSLDIIHRCEPFFLVCLICGDLFNVPHPPTTLQVLFFGYFRSISSLLKRRKLIYHIRTSKVNPPVKSLKTPNISNTPSAFSLHIQGP
jgi:hypothetical protein